MTKIRIKKTGEIKIVEEYATIPVTDCDSYGNPLTYSIDEVEIVDKEVEDWLNYKPQPVTLVSRPDWQQVKIQAAIGAMQGMIANSNEMDYRGMSSHKIYSDIMAERAVNYAHSLVEELKKDVNV